MNLTISPADADLKGFLAVADALRVASLPPAPPENLAAHCAAQIDSRITGKAVTLATKLFDSSDCWAKTIDLSCISVSKNAQATLIHPQYVASAVHWPYGTGPITFRNWTTGEIVSRNVVSQAAAISGRDMMLGLLDSPVPVGINFARVLPLNYADYLKLPVPALVMDQERKALVYELTGLYSTQFAIAPPMTAPRSYFYEYVINGDSSRGIFIIIAGKPVMIGHRTGGAGGMNYVPIQAKVWQLTAADLSGFARIA